MHFKHYENPYSRLAQYVNCAAANPGADAGMYDASEQYKLSTVLDHLSSSGRNRLRGMIHPTTPTLHKVHKVIKPYHM